jgi:hypothetical protein
VDSTASWCIAPPLVGDLLLSPALCSPLAPGSFAGMGGRSGLREVDGTDSDFEVRLSVAAASPVCRRRVRAPVIHAVTIRWTFIRWPRLILRYRKRKAKIQPTSIWLLYGLKPDGGSPLNMIADDCVRELHLPIVQCSVGISMPVSIAFAIQKYLHLGTCTLLVALSIGVSGCGGPWLDTYFKKGVGRLSQEEIRERLGPPHTAKTPALGGDSHWTYRFALSEQDLTTLNASFVADASHSVTSLMGKGVETAKPTLYCYRYTLTFAEDKTLKNWKREECVPGTRETLTAK